MALQCKAPPPPPAKPVPHPPLPPTTENRACERRMLDARAALKKAAASTVGGGGWGSGGRFAGGSKMDQLMAAIGRNAERKAMRASDPEQELACSEASGLAEDDFGFKGLKSR